MDILPLLRMLGALGVVLGLLVGALWVVRRYQIRLPGAVGGGGSKRRLELVERVSMDSRRAVALVRRDGREHLLLLAPEGNMVIETGILQDAIDADAAAARVAAAEAAALEAAETAARTRAEFKAMVDRAVDRIDEVKQGARRKSRKLAGRLGDVAGAARQRREASPEAGAVPAEAAEHAAPEFRIIEEAEAPFFALDPQLTLNVEPAGDAKLRPARARKPRQTGGKGKTQGKAEPK
jgi:flagellar biogenesis protein FliO